MPHTPGPWNAQRNDTAYGWDIRSDNGRRCLCETIGGEHQANAALIAAAPELLAALKNTLLCLSNWVEIADDEDYRDYDAEAMKQAEQAIAKAEGRTS